MEYNSSKEGININAIKFERNSDSDVSNIVIILESEAMVACDGQDSGRVRQGRRLLFIRNVA